MVKFQTKRYAIVIAVIGLLIFLHFSNLLLPVESFINNYTRPILASFYSFSSKLRLTYNQRTSKTDLAERVKQLENQVNQLIGENVELKMAETENQFLRQQLKFLSTNQSKYQIANIVSRGGLSEAAKSSQTILIDKGIADGIVTGLAVVSPNILEADSQGIIIGKVRSVKQHLSEINLITNPQCKLAVALLNQSKTNGIIHGELGLTVKMEFIPQTEEVKIGDLIVTSGLEQNINRGLVVGKITEVIKENNDLWQSAVIEPMINLDDLTIVAVLIP